MKGVYLKLFMSRVQQHKGVLLYEWVLEQAKTHEIKGGSAFQAIAGFGEHGVLHEEHFYELGSNVPVMVCFALEQEVADRFLAFLKGEHLNIFYLVQPSVFGHISGS